MKTSIPKSTPTLLLLLSFLLSAPQASLAQGTTFTYQGRLDSGGNPANGTYDLRFSIHAADNGGDMIAGPITNSSVSISDGLFTTTLGFGSSVFTGPARWLEIAVRTNGNSSFVPLTPRQALTPSPYAIHAGTASDVANDSVVRSLNGLNNEVTLAAGSNIVITPEGNSLTIAAAGGGGSGIFSLNGTSAYYSSGNVGIGTTTPATALEALGLVRSTRSGAPGQYLQMDGGDPVSIRLTAQSVAGAEKSLMIRNLTGEATPGANNSIQFAVGTATSPSTKMTINKDGNVLMYPAGGSTISFGTPNFETGMAIVGANRADIRFDGSTLKLLAGAGGGIPPSANGIAINTSGNVGIGTVTPTARIEVNSPSTASSANAILGVISSTSPGGSSAAVKGVNNGTGAAGIGVWGEQHGLGWGVYGLSSAGRGVFGHAQQSGGIGVYGENTAGGTGIVGTSTTGTGVNGNSSSGNGVTAFSASGRGLYASGSPAIYAQLSGPNPTTPYTAIFVGNVDIRDGVGGFGALEVADTVYATEFVETSDRRLKQHVEPWESAGLLEKIAALRPCTYELKTTPGESAFGLIAQAVEPLFPEVVSKHSRAGEETDIFGINYSKLSLVAVAAIQEQQKLIDTQAKKIESLEERLRRLERVLDSGGTDAQPSPLLKSP